ncbi:MAG: lactoylglutathione lyase [Clostridiales bacterium]|nr:lactoylglutathione lyase [Clostridiales bacterium]
MEFTFMHNNFNVLDLDKSIAFYKEALGLIEVRRFSPPDGSFTIVFMGDGRTGHQLELTWLRDRTEPYDLGDNEFHLAMCVEDIEEARNKHKEMGCVCYENKEMGIYFIEDPDGYWIELIPKIK